MPSYTLRQSLRPDRPARFHANGRRIGRAEYDRICETALRRGRLECFTTRAKSVPGGFFRVNESLATWKESGE